MKKFFLGMIVLILLAVSPAVSVRADVARTDPPKFYSAWGLAQIDGVISPGEWDNAASMSFDVNLPGGLTAPAIAYVMNDAHNLYFAVIIERPAMDWGSVILEFDNDNSSGFERGEGDDVFQINTDPFGQTPVLFRDLFRTYLNDCPSGLLCAFKDEDKGGTVDGEGQALNDGTYSVYELSHPLDSGDIGHDFSLKPGDTVGFTIFTQLQNVQTFYPSLSLSNWTFGDLLLAQPRLQDLVNFIAGLPDAAFINNPAQRKNAFAEKLKSIETMIEDQNYQAAIDKLQNDIRSKGDGCFGGNPHNDWIVGCDYQEEFLAYVDALIEYLSTLIS